MALFYLLCTLHLFSLDWHQPKSATGAVSTGAVCFSAPRRATKGICHHAPGSISRQQAVADSSSRAAVANISRATSLAAAV